MEERRTRERALLEARVDLGPERLEAVEADVLRRPLVAQCLERRRRLALPGRRERAALVVEPVERLLVGEIPAVLVEDERAAGRSSATIRSSACPRSRTWCSEWEATTASNGPSSGSRSSSRIRRKRSPCGASGSIPSTS